MVFRGNGVARALAATSLLSSLLAACSPSKQDSQAKDVFTEDIGGGPNGTANRHAATADEMLWTVKLGIPVAPAGEALCTGFLLSPTVMMTAGHCGITQQNLGSITAISGASFLSATGGSAPADITVTGILDQQYPAESPTSPALGSDPFLDYTILSITWPGGFPSNMHYPSQIATSASQLSMSQSLGQGDAIFTVGFPADKEGVWVGTYSQGNLRGVNVDPHDNPGDADDVYFDASIVNGNSGGGLFRSSDHLLVALANGGKFGIDPNNPTNTAWESTSRASGDVNWGPAMWKIYGGSQVLRSLFPNGLNATPGGTGPTTSVPSTGGSVGSGVSSSSGINVLIGSADPSQPATFTLYVSAPSPAQTVVFCQTSSASLCGAGAPGYTTTTLQRNAGSEGIFQAQTETTLSTGMQISAIATDANGNVIATQTMTFQATGN